MWTLTKKTRRIYIRRRIFVAATHQRELQLISHCARKAQTFPSGIMSRPCYNICIEWCKTRSHYWMRWYSKSSPQDPWQDTASGSKSKLTYETLNKVQNPFGSGDCYLQTHKEILQEVRYRLNLPASLETHDEWWCQFFFTWMQGLVFHLPRGEGF